MKDRISRLLHYCCVGMLQGRWAFKLDVDKVVSLQECIFWMGGLGIWHNYKLL